MTTDKFHFEVMLQAQGLSIKKSLKYTVVDREEIIASILYQLGQGGWNNTDKIIEFTYE